MKKIILTAGIALFLSALTCGQDLNFYCVDVDGKPHFEDTLTYKVKPGGFSYLPLAMPITGTCRVAFESYDDREDVNAAATTAIGNRVGVAIEPKGDIEILILDLISWENYLARRQYYAIWTSQRVFSDDREVKLRQGNYVLVINNRYGNFASKSVTLTLGRGQEPAPILAPTIPQTTRNEPYSTEPDEKPKLRKRPKIKP